MGQEKSWKEVVRIGKKRDSLSKSAESRAKELVAILDEIQALNIQLYIAAPKVDTLFDSSLISNAATMGHFRQYLAKLGWTWAMNLPWGAHEVRPFSEHVEAGSKWASKFMNQEIEAN